MNTFWCITTYFNPLGYRSRAENYRLFAESMQRQKVNLLTVELAFGDEPFQLPESDSLLRLRARSVLWQKERLINHAVARLPAECRYLAWIDCDLLCGNDDWAAQTVRLLQTFHVVQLFEKIIYLPPGHRRREIPFQPVWQNNLGYGIYRPSIAWQACSYPDWIDQRQRKRLFHAVPGGGWAVRREVAEQIGFYDRHVFGSGDMAFAEAVLNAWGVNGWFQWAGGALRAHLLDWGEQVARAGLTCGYVPQNVYHLFHGHIGDRNFVSRLGILEECDFDPQADIAMVNGVYEWSSDKPDLHAAVLDYFRGRKEDEI